MDRLTGDFKGASMFATAEQARQYNKLRQYEDTGLTPDEIAALRAERDQWQDGTIIVKLADAEAEVERLRAELDALKADIETGRLVPFTCDGCEREYQRDGICYDCYRGEMDMYSARAALEGGQHAEDDH